MAQAASRLRLTCRHGLDPRPFHVRFVVDKVALRHVFLQVLLFPPVNIIPPLLHMHLRVHFAVTRRTNGWNFPKATVFW